MLGRGRVALAGPGRAGWPAAFGRIHTAANGARGRFDGVEPRDGNVRMMRYYGFYRTRADARVILEAGPAGADDAFLARTDLIARTVANAIASYLGR